VSSLAQSKDFFKHRFLRTTVALPVPCENHVKFRTLITLPDRKPSWHLHSDGRITVNTEVFIFRVLMPIFVRRPTRTRRTVAPTRTEVASRKGLRQNPNNAERFR